MCRSLIGGSTGDGPILLEGLVATDPDAVEPYLMHVIGQPRSHLPASGLVGALEAEDVETRWAAVEAIRAVIVQYGPRVDLAQVT